MDELNCWGHQHATDIQRNSQAQRIVEQVFDSLRSQFVAVVDAFLKQAISPTALYQFELALLLLVRELGRLVLQAAVQSLEPANSSAWPKDLYFQCGGYHVSERVWAMAGALFTKSQERQSVAWARRMLKDLKRPSGASRVLHSAASLLSRRKLGKTRLENYQQAYRYIQERTSYLKYHDYKRHHLPIGSGVTEAACKTVFTQRLKLSGMRWSHSGAGQILTLRTILLSGTWEAT